ncbi:MAG: ribbon-helix-helix protein, CopG family, partial [Candidatus Aenigmarchaeota archaeon]|nr:ribbon-helix-helix protein, CopG family [Candidatus Aenigmarchaeota archaeon]
LFYLTPELIALLNKESHQTNQSQSQIIRELLDHHYGKVKPLFRRICQTR